MSEPTNLRTWRSWPLIETALAVLLAGCVTRPPQVLTPQLVPRHFVGPSPQTAQVWPRTGWWRGFHSPELSRLIELAQRGNRNLVAATATVKEAMAEVTIQRSALFPAINAQATAQRLGAESGAFSTTGQPIGVTTNAFSLNGNVSYDLDVWGLARDNLRSAEDTVTSDRFARRAAALTVTADVADGYFNILALNQEIAITREDIAAIEAIVDIVKVKVKAGTVSHLDLAQEQAQAASVRAQLPVLRQREIAQHAALAVLVGIPPEVLHLGKGTERVLRIPLVRPGLPSALLLRRPDVAEAEANLAAAHANLQAARAAFLPQLSLSGSAGFSSTAANALLHGPGFLWDAGAQLVQTIFDGGKLIGQKDLAFATQEKLVADYENAVLQAYADVETALGELSTDQQEEHNLEAEVAAAREAFRIGELQYREGTAGLLTVLQTQETLFAARDQLVQVRLARMQAVVQLYEALGGGWTEPRADRTQFLYRRPGITAEGRAIGPDRVAEVSRGRIAR